MKKSHFLFFVLLCFVNITLFANPSEPARVIKHFNTGHFSTLIINAEVTLVLVDNLSTNQAVKVEGEANWMKYLEVKQSGDTLTIAAKKKKCEE